MVVGSFAFVLCASALALIGAVFVQTDQGLAQILLTVFTTVGGFSQGSYPASHRQCQGVT